MKNGLKRVSKILTRIIVYILGLGYAFVSAIYFPTFLRYAFGWPDGISSDADRFAGIPFGIIVVLSTISIDFFIVRNTIKSKEKSIAEKICFICLFVIVKAVATIPTLFVWEDFFKTLVWKLTH